MRKIFLKLLCNTYQQQINKMVIKGTANGHILGKIGIHYCTRQPVQSHVLCIIVLVACNQLCIA